MVKATVINDGRRHMIQVEDHATGSEQVCAGVSAIVYALAGWCRGHCGDRAEMRLDPGSAWVRVEGKGEDVTTAFSVAIIGLLQIEKGYPEYIRVEAAR